MEKSTVFFAKKMCFKACSTANNAASASPKKIITACSSKSAWAEGYKLMLLSSSCFSPASLLSAYL
jgi:hypothetical protein